MRKRRTGRARAVVGTTTAMFMASLLLTPTAQAVEDADSGGASSGVVSAPDRSTARSAARSAGHEVLIDNLTTATSRTWAEPDGSYKTELDSAPVRLRRGGQWLPIDTTLAPLLGRISAAVVPAAYSFSPGGSGPLVSWSDNDGHVVSLSWPSALPVPTLVGNVATYADALPNVDLVLLALPSGWDLLLRLKSRPADPVDVSVPWTMQGLTVHSDEGAGFSLQGSDGKDVLVSPPAAMWDSFADEVTGEGHRSDGVVVDASASGMRIRPDAGFLADPATQYPVVVDPQMTIGSTTSLYVRDTAPTSSFYNPTNLYIGNDYTHTYRSFLRFPDWTNVQLSTVTSAYLKLYNNYSSVCRNPPDNTQGVNIFSLASPWSSGTTWNNQPATAALAGTANFNHGHGSCPAAYDDVYVTPAIQAWADGSNQIGDLEIRARSEGTAYGYKRFNSPTSGSGVPTLYVTYEQAPSTPWGLQLVTCDTTSCSPVATRDSSPGLSASSSDGDGDGLRFDFEVWNGSTLTSSGSASTTGCAGCIQSATWYTPSSIGDGNYQLRVRAWDGWVYSSWSSWFSFIVDAGGPTSPTVNSSSHSNEMTYYSANNINFDWGASALSGVKGYTTVLDQLSGTVPPATNPTSATTASFTNKLDGCYYLHARAQSNVGVWGNAGQRKTCVDATVPNAPTSVYSTNHAVNTPSNNTSIAMTGSGASDPSSNGSASGISGYSYVFNTSSTAAADTVRDVLGTTFSTSSSALADGNWYFHVRAIDNAGNASSDLVTGPFPIDTLAPAAPSPYSYDATSGSWSPNSWATFYWNAPSDTSGINGYSLVLDETQSTLPPASISTTGTSQYYGNISDGTHYLHARTVDKAGNWSGSASLFTLMVDSSAPVAPSVGSSTHPDQSQWSTNNLPSFTFSAFDLSGITGLSYVLDRSSGTIPDSTLELSGVSSGSYTAPSGLPDGLNYFHVRAKNGSGLLGDTYHYVIRVDRAAPNVAPSPTSDHSTSGVSNNQILHLDWTSSPGGDAHSGIAGYSVTVNTSAGTAADSTLDQVGTTYAYTVPGDGSYYFHIRAIDRVGNIAGDTVLGPYKIDLTAPSVPSISSGTHPQNVWSADSAGTFTFSAADLNGVSGYSALLDETQSTVPPATVNASSTWTQSSISDGTHYVHARAQDAASNWSDQALYTILVDATAPVAPTVTSSTHSEQSLWSTNDAPGFSFTDSDTSGITGYSWVMDRASGTVPDTTPELSGVGSGTASFSGLADGLNYFHVRAVNGSGLLSLTTTYVIKVDKSAPNVAPTVISTDHQVSTPSNNTSLPLTWAAAPGADAYSGVAGYSIAVNTSQATPADTTLDLTGTSTTVTLPGEGSFYVHIRAIDAVGNVGADTITGPFSIDLTNPATPVISSSDHNQTDWSANPTASFTWPVPADASGISGYAVLLDQSATTIPAATVNTSAPSWTVSGLTDGVYYLHVRPRDLAGNWGQPSAFVLHIDVTAPAAPAVSSASHPTAGAWSTDNNPQFGYTGTDLSGIAGYAYTLDQIADTDPASTVQDTSGGTTVSGLADGWWYLHVRAINGSGLPGAVATYQIGVDRSAPTAPTITSPTHEPNVITNHRVVTVDWVDAPGADPLSSIAGYSVVLNDSATSVADATLESPQTTFTSASLTDGTYWIHVRTIDNVGLASSDSVFGPIVIDAVRGLPYRVQEVAATAGDGAATVNWTPADDNGSSILGYEITAEPDGQTKSVGPGVYETNFDQLENGTAYTFYVTARNLNGESLPSLPNVEVVPAGDVSAVPEVVAQEKPYNRVEVRWLLPDLNGSPDAIFTVTLQPGGLTKTTQLSWEEGDAPYPDEPRPSTTSVVFEGVEAGTYTASVVATGVTGVTSAPTESEVVVVQGALPAAPTGLTAVPGDAQVTLSWAPALNNGSPITQYEVLINGDESNVRYVDGADTAFIVSELANGTLHSFDVYATNDLGRSSTPSHASATPVDAGNMAAVNATTAKDVRATRGDKSARLTWTPPQVFVAGTTKYRITSHPKTGSSSAWVVASSPATVTGLTNGVPVTFSIATWGASTTAGPVTGPESNPSNSVTPAGLPSAPSSVTASGMNGAIKLVWPTPNNNGDAIRNYLVQVYDSDGFVEQRRVGASPQRLTGLTIGRDYTFTAKAQNAVGVGPASPLSNSQCNCKVPSPPASPELVQIDRDTLRVTWDPAPDNGAPVTKYVVTAEPKAPSGSVTLGSGARSHDFNGLTLGESYTVHVVAYNKFGRGQEAVTDTVTIAAAPSAPTQVKATPVESGAKVRWIASNANGARVKSYTIFTSPGTTTKTVSGTSVPWTGLTNGQTYVFYVYATNAKGNSSTSYSNSVTPTEEAEALPPKTQPGESPGSNVRINVARLAMSQDQANGHNKEHEWGVGRGSKERTGIGKAWNCNYFTAYWGNRGYDRGVDDKGKPTGSSCTTDPRAPVGTANGQMTDTAEVDTKAEFWCADFVGWVLDREGIDLGGSSPATAAAISFKGWAKKQLTWHGKDNDPNYVPKEGDLAVWNGHIAIVTKVGVRDANGHYHARNFEATNGNADLKGDSVGSVDVVTKPHKYLGGGTVYDGRNGWAGFASIVDAQGRPITKAK